MRIIDFKCPVCEQPVEDIVEELIIHANVDIDEFGRGDYSGNTTINWDNQEPCMNPEGGWFVRCAAGHEWSTDIVWED